MGNPPNLTPNYAALPLNAFSVQKQPTAAGAIENDPEFRKAAIKVLTSAGAMGSTSFEGRMTVNKQGKSKVLPPTQEAYKGTMPVDGNTFATLHSHPENGHAQGVPSPADIQSAVRTGVPFYVTSADGLYMVRPSDGKVIQVSTDSRWMMNKKK